MNNIPMLAGLLKPRDIKVEDKFDKILKAQLANKIDELPEDLQKVIERWRFVKRCLSQGYLVKKGKKEIYLPYKYDDLVDFLVAEYRISVRTAYDDIKATKRFYAFSDSKSDDDFAKGIFLEKLEEMMWESYANGDRMAASSFSAQIIKIRQWDKPSDAEMPKYGEMQIPTLILVADPSELGFPKLDNPDAAVKRILAKRKKSKIDSIFADAEAVDLMNVNGGTEDLAK
jgi:hypothetical protein